MAPVLLVFLAAIVNFGLALHARTSVQQAVREGARKAAVGATLAEVQTLASENANEWIDPTEVQWCHPVGPSGTQGKIGDPVRVYLEVDGDEGFPYTLVPSNGILESLGVPNLVIRMSPRATARLEKTVSAAAVVNCT
jgi:hypothetical protein